ncbi:hypothetical protein ACP275_13G151500 [Erythranthe tilingii]
MDQMPRAALDPLVVGKVIGDVLDMFVPVAELAVHYGGGEEIGNGSKVKPSSAAQRPKVQIKGAISPNYYTLVMVDPDAPSPGEPTLREWLHWLVIDIPEGSDATEGKEIMECMGPKPPAGVHRTRVCSFPAAWADGNSEKEAGGVATVRHAPIRQ